MINTYPHDDLHVLNLDWLMSEYKRLASELSTLVTKFNDIENNFKSVQNGFINLKKEFDNLLKVMDSTIAEITDSKIAEAMVTYSEELALIKTQFETLLNRVNALESLALDLSEVNKAYTDSSIEQLRRTLQTQISALAMDIEDLQWTLPKVYNITRGIWTDLVTCLYDVYDACRDYAYTAGEFDSFGFNCTTLDSNGYTAYELDSNGRVLLKPDGYCRNPVTGEIASVCNILEDIMHVATGNNALTAGEYDTIELTAQSYDDMSLNAFTYDYYGGMFTHG